MYVSEHLLQATSFVWFHFSIAHSSGRCYPNIQWWFRCHFQWDRTAEAGLAWISKASQSNHPHVWPRPSVDRHRWTLFSGHRGTQSEVSFIFFSPYWFCHTLAFFYTHKLYKLNEVINELKLFPCRREKLTFPSVPDKKSAGLDMNRG